MASVTIPQQNRTITDSGEIAAFLQPHGIWYRRTDVAGRLGPRAGDAEILAAYDREITELKERGGYVTADVINVTADTPNLDVMLNKFNKEHRHDEDEVRFIVHGRGVFHINPDSGDPVFAIEVEAGDMINVPAGTRHWFDLCADRTIRAIRLFLEQAGWTPHYTESGVDESYVPLCLGPTDIPPGEGFKPSVPI